MAEPKIGTNRGNAGKGRPKGVPNKLTLAAKECIQQAFESLGSTEGLVTWCQKDPDNQKAFYTQIWPKIVPLQVNGSGDDGEHIHEIVFKVRSGKPGG